MGEMQPQKHETATQKNRQREAAILASHLHIRRILRCQSDYKAGEAVLVMQLWQNHGEMKRGDDFEDKKRLL